MSKDQNNRILETKELVDHAFSKIPGPACRDVEISVEWESVVVGDDDVVVPSVRIKWTQGKEL